MKKILYIVGGVAVFFVIALFGLLWYTLSKMELDSNRAKTANARAARHQKTEPQIDPSNEDQVNKLLDDINDKKNEKED
jgi:hypothetical protein